MFLFIWYVYRCFAVSPKKLNLYSLYLASRDLPDLPGRLNSIYLSIHREKEIERERERKREKYTKKKRAFPL